MNKALNVLYQFDDNYAPYAGISIYSLYKNNRNIDHINVYCAAMNVSENNLYLLRKTADNFNRKIIFLDTHKSVKKIKELKLNEWNGSLACWLKIFIIEDLIDTIDCLLYIDSDTVVVGSLEELCDFSFDEAPLACVASGLGFKGLKRLRIEENQYYYNVGVILFNMKYFRENKNCHTELITHLTNNSDKYLVNEEDLINDFWGKQIKRLDLKYNILGIHYFYPDNVYFKLYGKYSAYSKNEITSARNDACIIHFVRFLGDYPWIEGNIHPCKKTFLQWKKLTLWKDLPLVKVHHSILFKLEKGLYKCLPKLMFFVLLDIFKTKIMKLQRKFSKTKNIL